MTRDRKPPSTAFWLTVALVAVLVAYPLSYPWAQIVLWRATGDVPSAPSWFYEVYAPLGWAVGHSPKSFRHCWYRYYEWCMETAAPPKVTG